MTGIATSWRRLGCLWLIATAASGPPGLAGQDVLLEVETFDGAWRYQTNVPGFSGWGFRVSNARGVAATELRTRADVGSAGTYAVWARGHAAADQDRSFSVEVAGFRLEPTHGRTDRPGFRWERCGVVDVEAGTVDIVIRDAGGGYECPDAVFLGRGADARPAEITEARDWPADLSAAALTERNLRLQRELHAGDDQRRREMILGAAPTAERAAWLRSRLSEALGLAPEPPRTPLRARTVGRLERDGYIIEKVVFESRPGMAVPASLYLPETGSSAVDRRPTVLCPVGHWGLSKAEPTVQARAVGLAKLGFVALVYDALGQGERAVPGNEHSVAYLAGLVGRSNMTYMVWDSVRAIDYLETRPEVDPERIGVTGCSGGGLNTLYLIAVEPRLKAAAPVGYVCTFRSFLSTGITHCPCSHVPGVARFTDMGEIASLLAPRPLLVIGGRDDPMFTEAGMREAFDEIREHYASRGAPGAAELFFDDCGHDYSRPMRERAYGFFLRHLAGKDAGPSIREPMEGADWKPEPPDALFCFSGGKLPETTTSYRESVLAAVAVGGRDRSSAASRGPAASRWARWWRSWRTDLRNVGDPEAVCRLEARPGWVAEARADGDGFVSRALVRKGGDHGTSSVLVLDEAGLTSGTQDLIETLGGKGARSVAAVEPPLWGLRGSAGHLAATDGLLTGRPLPIIWARSVIARARSVSGPVVLVARGPCASVTALLAALAEPDRVQGVVAVGAPGSWTELVEPAVASPAALPPGLGAVGDLPDLVGLRAPLPIVWCGAGLDPTAFPSGVSVRDRDPDAAELARWIEDRAGHLPDGGSVPERGQE